MAEKVVLKVWGDELVFSKVSQNNVEFEIPQKALKFLCYALSNENIVTMWHNEKSFYESGELKSIAFIDYLNEDKGQKCRNVYEFSKERDLLSFESIYANAVLKITELNYVKNKVSGKIELAKNDDFKKIEEFFGLLKRDDNALAMMYKNDNLTKEVLLKGEYSLYSGDVDDDFEGEPKVNSYMTFEYDKFGVLKNFGIDEEIQENPGTTSCVVRDNGGLDGLQLDCRLYADIYTFREMEDLLNYEIKGDIALVEMREFNKDKLKSIFGEYECDEKGDIKSFENKNFSLKEVFLKYVFDLWSDESEDYEELVDKRVKKGEDEYELCGYKLVDDVCDEFSFCGAFICKMMTFEVPVKYISRIEKVMIEESSIYKEGEIALSKAILMF